MASRLPRMPGGVLVPSRLTYDLIDHDLSDYTETGGRPGVPEAVTEGARYRVRVSGGQGEDLETIAVRSGHPGTMAVAYRLPDQGEDTDWRGWNPPMWWDGWAAAHASSSTVTFRRHDIITLPATQEAVLIRRVGSSSVVGARRVAPATLELDLVGEQISAQGSGWEYPAAAVIPDDRATGGGRIVLVYDARVYTSTDAGATWTLHSKHPIADDTSDFGAARLAYQDGQLLLVVQDTGTADRVHQYVSTDEGATFTLVASVDDVGDSLQLAATDQGFVLGYRRSDGSATWIYSRTVPTAGSSLEYATEVEVYTYVIDAGEDGVALAAEPDGTLWCLHSVGDYVTVHHSADTGATWTRTNGSPYDTLGGATKLRYLSATCAAGRLLVAHSWEDGDAGIAAGLAVLALGGWSSWTTGPPTGGPGWSYGDRMGSVGYTDSAGVSQISGTAWVPVVRPGDVGWTRTGSAAVLANGWLNIKTASFNSQYFTISPAIWNGGIVVQTEVIVSSGGTSGSLRCGLQVIVSDGSSMYALELCMTPAEIQARDGVALAAIDTEALDLTAGLQLQVEVREDGVATVGYRTRGATRWTYLIEEHELTAETGSPDSNGTVRWGHISAGTAESRWRWLTVAAHSTTHQPRLYRGDEAYGRTMTGRPTPIPDAADEDGVVPWLRAVTGPARHGEVLRLPVAYDYGLAQAFPAISPSPSRAWVGDASTQRLVFDLGQAGWVGDAIGVYVRGHVDTFALECSDDGKTWELISTGRTRLMSQAGIGAISGDHMEVTLPFSESVRYIWEGELAGGWMKWTNPFPASGGGVREIAWNTAGHLTGGADLRPLLRLAGVDGSEPASVRNVHIHAPQALLVIYPEARLKKRYWRISLTPPSTGLRGAIVMAGRIFPWGAEVDLTRSDTYQTNVSESRNSYGVSRLRERGPLTRTWRFAWGDGARRGLLRATSDPDYIGVDGGLPLHAGEDVGEQVAAIVRETRSGQIPVVCIERLPETSGEVITDPTRILYGRLRGAPSINGMAGDPVSVHEYVRVEGLSVEEIP